MPLSPNYWTQAGILIDYFRQIRTRDLKGKKIVLVAHRHALRQGADADLPGAAPRLGYTLQTFPYRARPATSRRRSGPQVRRAQPDWVIFWGAGVGQTVALSEAVRNGLKHGPHLVERVALGVRHGRGRQGGRQGRAQVRRRPPAAATQGDPGHHEGGQSARARARAPRRRSAPATTTSASCRRRSWSKPCAVALEKAPTARSPASGSTRASSRSATSPPKASCPASP